MEISEEEIAANEEFLNELYDEIDRETQDELLELFLSPPFLGCGIGHNL